MSQGNKVSNILTLLEKNTTEDIYNNLLKYDAEDLNKWKLQTIVGYKRNRLLSFPCNLIILVFL